MADGKRHGQGKYTYLDGAVYEGEWRDGKRHGQGKETSAGRRLLRRRVADGKRHGQGKYTYRTAPSTTASREGKRHGQGKHTFPDGAFYDGQWQDDKRHGRGAIIDGNDQFVGIVKPSGAFLLRRLCTDVYDVHSAPHTLTKRYTLIDIFTRQPSFDGLVTAFLRWRLEARRTKLRLMRARSKLRALFTHWATAPEVIMARHQRNEDRRQAKNGIASRASHVPASPPGDAPTSPAYRVSKSKARKPKRRDQRTPRSHTEEQDEAPVPWCDQVKTDPDLLRQNRRASADRAAHAKAARAAPLEEAQDFINLHTKDVESVREVLRAKVIGMRVDKKRHSGLEVITGKGLHSAPGGSTLKPEVAMLLEAWGCSFSQLTLSDGSYEGFYARVNKVVQRRAKKARDAARGERPAVTVAARA